MKKYLYISITLLFLLVVGISNVGAAVIINTNSFIYGDSWDDPSDEVEAVLMRLQDEIYPSSTGDVNLTLLDTETWVGFGVQSIILEELAGYKNNTTFGWYDTSDLSSTQIFDGSDSDGTEATVTFSTETDFGFYIDPNGISGDRMYTENWLNSEGDIQVAIFKIEELENSYILGWEDLDLLGADGGDMDYQDMIVRVTIAAQPVPEPATMLLFGIGLLGLADIGRRKK